MAQFLIIPTDRDSTALDSAIKSKLGNKAYRLPLGEWLAVYDGTSKQLSDYLGVSEGEIGVGAVIASFTGYFGRAPKDIWEWISLNSAA